MPVATSRKPFVIPSTDELERIARECLGMVKPGEIAFVVVPKGGHTATPSDC